MGLLYALSIGFVCLIGGGLFGWFFLGPMMNGHLPFTTPQQAARGERLWRRR